MPTYTRQPTRLSRRYRILSIVLGFAISGLSGGCMLSGRGGLIALLGKLFYPGLLTGLIVIRHVNMSTIIMAFLLNAIFYLLVCFFLFRWRATRS